MYTIVDIETTGGTASRHKIIEIAIVTFDGAQIVDAWSTFINPNEPVPAFITSLTGISTRMIEQAPTFAQVAPQILEKTHDKVFVAHNVNFDFGFLKKEFAEIGITFDRKKLCTVRLAKNIVPGFRSYGLGSLTGALGITIENRHRALGDALATARVLDYLLRNDRHGFVALSLKRHSGEGQLPANLPREVYTSLPEGAGVYYFLNAKGKVVYVGKAKNIRSRVWTHFTGDSAKEKQLFHEVVHDVQYELTGNELIALLLESREIKRLWPEYNKSQKTASSNYGVYLYTDRLGYHRLSSAHSYPGSMPVAVFSSLSQSRSFLQALVAEHSLCPRLCGLQITPGPCFDSKIGKCDGACKGSIPPDQYNQRVNRAISEAEGERRTHAIFGKGRQTDEISVVLVENGVYLGHGFVERRLRKAGFSELQQRIQSFPDNDDVQRILRMYMKNPVEGEVVYCEKG
ncbi:MAG: exonuclease domain-containing protein [Cyclobacteriaceae bacterium]|nr:exonuclease domain-containing protein [Cyclobacteriaceae bacterium]